MSTQEVIDVHASAQRVQATHTELVKLTMLLVDLMGDVQQGKERLNMLHMREATGQKLRKLSAQHSVELAALIYEQDPEYADALVDYSVEMCPPAAA